MNKHTEAEIAIMKKDAQEVADRNYRAGLVALLEEAEAGIVRAGNLRRIAERNRIETCWKLWEADGRPGPFNPYVGLHKRDLVVEGNEEAAYQRGRADGLREAISIQDPEN